MTDGRPKKKRAIGLFILILIIQFGAAALNAPDYIPGWVKIIIGMTLFLYLVLLILMVLWSVRVYRNAVETFGKAKAFGRQLIFSGLMVLWLAASLFITALFFDTEFMGNKFVEAYEFPDYGKTIYLYDDSFLDPVSTFKVREGMMPWMDFKARMVMDPSQVKLTQQDSLAVATDGVAIFTYNLQTGEFSTNR